MSEQPPRQLRTILKYLRGRCVTFQIDLPEKTSRVYNSTTEKSSQVTETFPMTREGLMLFYNAKK